MSGQTGANHPSATSQLGIILLNKDISVPRVSLSDTANEINVSISDNESVLAYNTTTDENVSSGYYYWYENTWHSLFNEVRSPDYIMYWDLQDNLLSYVNDQGLMLTTAIGGLDALTYSGLNLDGRSLDYKDQNGDIYSVDLGQIVKGNRNVITFVRAANGDLIYMNEREERITFNMSVPEIKIEEEQEEVLETIDETMEEELMNIDEETLDYEVDVSVGEDEVDDSIEDEIKEVEPAEFSASLLSEKEAQGDGKDIKSIEDNDDGTFTVFFTDGTRFTSRDLGESNKGGASKGSLEDLISDNQEILDVVNNGDGTIAVLFKDGTTLPSLDLASLQGFAGYSQEGPEDRGIALVMDNGDGTYTFMLTDGSQIANVDLTKPRSKQDTEEDGKGVLMIMPHADGSYTVLFTDGTEVSSEELGEEYQLEMRDMMDSESVEEEEVADLPEDENNEQGEKGDLDLEEADAEVEDDEMEEESSSVDSNDMIDEQVEDFDIEEGDEEESVIEEPVEEESIEEDQEIKIQKVLVQGDGSFKVILTSGDEVITPVLTNPGGIAQDRGIESIVDYANGSFDIILTDGTVFSSEEYKRDRKSKITDSGTKSDGNEDEAISGSDSLDELEEKVGEETVEQKAVEEPMEIEEHDNDINSEESIESDVEDSLEKSNDDVEGLYIQTKEQEGKIKAQEEEIEALKRREREKEEELQEMKERLKRLELLIDTSPED